MQVATFGVHITSPLDFEFFQAVASEKELAGVCACVCACVFVCVCGCVCVKESER